jgi:hypothetical protein
MKTTTTKTKRRTTEMATRKKKAAKRRPRKVDFDDQDAVLVEVAKHLEIDPDELRIEESTDLTNFGDFDGVVYRIYFRGDRTGGKEWKVIENHDKMYDLAIQVVTQDLEEEPENFNKEFIEHHINTDRLRRELESDVQTMAEEDLREMSSRQFWQTAERYLDSVPEEDGEGEMPDPEDYIDDVASKIAEERLKDPMEYLDEIYGDEAAAKAIEIAGIDIEAAAEEAVDTDGAEHFLARYDSNYYTTPSGFVYWRDN